MYQQILKDVSSCIKNMIFKGTALDPSTFEKNMRGEGTRSCEGRSPLALPTWPRGRLFRWCERRGVKKVNSLKASVWGMGAFFVGKSMEKRKIIVIVHG